LSFEVIQTYLYYLILFLVIALLIWMIEDSIKRFVNKWLFPLIAIVFTVIPFLITYIFYQTLNYYSFLTVLIVWFIYLIIRPTYTLDEMKVIEDELKLKELKRKYYEYELNKGGKICPVCGLPIEDNYKICPNCYKELREKCTECGQLIEVSWNLCPYCGKKISRGKEYENPNI